MAYFRRRDTPIDEVCMFRSANTHLSRRRLANCFIQVAVLLALSTEYSHSQSTDPLHTYFKQNIGLTDSEISEIEHGKAVAKVLDSEKPSQVFVFGAIFIKAQPTAFMRWATDLDRLKSLPNYLAIQRFSIPPKFSDLSGLAFDAGDLADLQKCTPGNCEVQLPAENIEQFKSQIDWSGPNSADQVNDLARKMALQALVAYQKGGDASLGTYRDKKLPTQVSQQFRSLLSRSKALPDMLPPFYSYLLDYPNAILPNSNSLFYWEKVKFGLKPTIRINQLITVHLSTENGPIDAVAIKQIYSSHYFQTALDLYFCIPNKTTGFYLVTLKGSEQAGLAGPKGAIVRKVAVDNTRTSLQKSLQATKAQLEEK